MTRQPASIGSASCRAVTATTTGTASTVSASSSFARSTFAAGTGMERIIQKRLPSMEIVQAVIGHIETKSATMKGSMEKRNAPPSSIMRESSSLLRSITTAAAPMIRMSRPNAVLKT